MRLRCPKLVKALFHAIVVALLLVCVLELGLRVYDSHARQQVSRTRQGEGLVVPSWTVHHELKPLRTVSVPHPDDPEVSITIRTNSLGLRGPEPVVPKPPELFRVLVLGDEIVFGPDVAHESSMTARLQTILSSQTGVEVEVVNAGVPGDSPLLSYLRYRRSLAALRPDVVLAVFDMADVADDHRLRRHTEMTEDGIPIASPNMELVRGERSKGVCDAEWLLLPTFCKQRLGELVVTADDGVGATDADSPQGRYAWLRGHSDWDVYVEQTFSVFDLLRDAAAADGAAFVVAAHPAPWQISDKTCCVNLRTSLGIGADEWIDDRRAFERLGRYLGERRIPYCDASVAFRGSPSPETLYLTNAPRLTRDGHDLYARVMATYLLKRVAGPWRSEPASPSPPGPLPHAMRGTPWP